MRRAYSSIIRTLHLCFRLGLLILAVDSSMSTAPAQDLQTKGAIAGKILDPAGAAIPGVSVAVIGPHREYATTSNRLGDFAIANLLTPESTRLGQEFRASKEPSWMKSKSISGRRRSCV